MYQLQLNQNISHFPFYNFFFFFKSHFLDHTFLHLQQTMYISNKSKKTIGNLPFNDTAYKVLGILPDQGVIKKEEDEHIK